jgi:DNA-binding NtrC family response regulator
LLSCPRLMGSRSYGGRSAALSLTTEAAMFSRILLVEDHADTAMSFCQLLCMTGYYVRVAEDYRSALGLASEDYFDLVVADIGLPDGSGLDLMRELSSRYKMRGIAVSGYGSPKDFPDSKDAGFCAHILKPATFERIQEAIEECVSPPLEPTHIIGV